MRPVQCPVCHEKPAYVGNAVYCPHCGWNRDAAISMLKMSRNSMPIGIAMFLGVAAFMYWGMKFNRSPMLMIFWLVPATGVVINFFSVRRSLAKLQAMAPKPAEASVPTNAPSNFQTGAANAAGFRNFPPSERDEALLRTPAPRQIRVSKRGRITMWVASIGLSIFVVPMAAGIYRQWALSHSFATVHDLGWAVAIEGLVALVVYGIWSGQKRECDLLEHGEVVMGRVVRQWTDNKNNSWIEYEFADFLGSSHRGSARDETDQLFAGMPVAIFYDRDKPSRQIAACATLHEVILPASPAASADAELITKQ
jgi:hypothetical protein